MGAIFHFFPQGKSGRFPSRPNRAVFLVSGRGCGGEGKRERKPPSKEGGFPFPFLPTPHDGFRKGKGKMKMTAKPIEFFWQGIPPKATSQTRRRTAKNPRGYRTPQNALACATLRAVVEPYAPAVPMTGALALTASFTFPGSKAIAAPKTTRPDLDNLTKDFLDALAKARYFTDDAQVASLCVMKYAGQIPGLYIKLEQIP